MHKLSSIVLVLFAAGALAAWASGGTTPDGAGRTSSPSVAAIADSSTSWAEFSAREPNLPADLALLSQQTLDRSRAQLASTLAEARLATAKYATNLARAKADGYRIITRMIPDMGYHFLNPKVTGFSPTKPASLVYLRRGNAWQLGALEWVFTKKPKTPPLPGARYGTFGAACHYTDGTVVPERSPDGCAKTSPQTGAAFGFWHPDLVTLHVWLWYPNPAGIYSGMNPLVHPFNRG